MYGAFTTAPYQSQQNAVLGCFKRLWHRINGPVFFFLDVHSKSQLLVYDTTSTQDRTDQQLSRDNSSCRQLGIMLGRAGISL